MEEIQPQAPARPAWMTDSVDALLSFCNQKTPGDNEKDGGLGYDADELDEIATSVYDEGEDEVIKTVLEKCGYNRDIEGFKAHEDSMPIDLPRLVYHIRNRTSIPQHVGINFCSECNNMMLPAEDKERRSLVYKCRSCGQQENTTDFCVYVNTIKQDAKPRFAINSDVVSDPTLSHDLDRSCPSCGHQDAVYFQAQVNREKSNMALYYVCCACHHEWRDQNDEEAD